MDAWLIKLGKAWSAMRREGVFRGGKRVLASISVLFRRVEAGDVLFVASGAGDSARYRCEHIAESLRFKGFRASVIHQDSPFLLRSVDSFKIFVFHRTSWTPAVESLVRKLEALEKTVIFDTDDLTFDAELFKRTAAHEAMNVLERRQYQNGIGAEFLKSPAVSAVTTSTAFLAERLRVFGKPVFVVPNRLNSEDAKMAEAILERKVRNKESETTHGEASDVTSPVSIGYFSGSAGHDRDFATVAPVLKRLLDEFRQLRLFIGGPVSLPKMLELYSSRIDRVSFVSRAENFKNIAGVDINIAPLEVGDPFCEAKSELKFFEAGIVGVPTVASATGTFRQAISDGIDGYVAEGEGEWYEKVLKLVREGDFRENIGKRARETALRSYVSGSATDGGYGNFLKERL